MILNKNINETYQPLVPFMPANPKVAHGYVPYQIMPDYMDIDDAFIAGTLFPDLVVPVSHTIRKEVQ